MADRVPKKEAFEKLLQIVNERSISLYAYADDFYKGGRNWPLDWEKNLEYCHFRSESDRQSALNRTLEDVAHANFPSTMEQMNKERGLIRLILDAGANPNFYSSHYDRPIFDQFLLQRKSYAALEIAKTTDFMGPKNPDGTFNILYDSLAFYLNWNQPPHGDTKEETAVINQNCSDRKDLVYLLLQKGIYPRDVVVFENLVPIVLEKDPNFFEKKKQQVIHQITRAKTPIEIYNAIMGQEKEKS